MTNKVLIVDDDPNLLDGLSRALHREPYIVLTSTSCQEALKMLETTSVDVIISDQDMPEMPGTDFLKYSRAFSPNSIRMMLTGKATLDTAMEAVNTGGISRFFIKPCNPADLAHAIRQGIQQHRLTDAAFRLLQKNKRQSGMIRNLEKKYPNISKVERDADGAIVIDEFNGDVDRLIEEIDSSLKVN
jgi:two-component system, probable response regulator PhcQ